MVVTVTTTTSKIDSHTKVFLLEGVTDLRKRPSYLQMNYAYQYFKIIANRVEHPLTREDCYVERHHVIPKSEGG